MIHLRLTLFRTFVLGVLVCAINVGTSLILSGCAYTWGVHQTDLPGGYKQIAIPVFENQTELVGIEGHFTNALIEEFNRSKIATVVSKDVAPAYIKGTITKVNFIHGSAQIDANNRRDKNIGLPPNTVLTLEYRVNVTAEIQFIRKSDKKVLYQGAFDNEGIYTVPQVGRETLNTVNPLYDHSTRINTVKRLAMDMMNDAHDRMTESF